MGKLEKVVVLSVLFVIAVILVVSLTVDDPLDKDHVAIAGAPAAKVAAAQPSTDKVAVPSTVPTTPAATPAATGAPASSTPSPSALLSMNTPAATGTEKPATPVATPVPTVSPLPAGALLKTTEGLSDSYLPDMKFYTWKSSDSLRSIAERYYGDATKLALLRRHNEGRVDVQAGEKILIPVFDLESPMTAASSTTATEPIADATPAKSGKGVTATQPAKPNATGARTHVVKEGESLWKIAKQELGSGARWKEVYEANRDVLATPESVHTGLRLRIP